MPGPATTKRPVTGAVGWAPVKEGRECCIGDPLECDEVVDRRRPAVGYERQYRGEKKEERGDQHADHHEPGRLPVVPSALPGRVNGSVLISQIASTPPSSDTGTVPRTRMSVANG